MTTTRYARMEAGRFLQVALGWRPGPLGWDCLSAGPWPPPHAISRARGLLGARVHHRALRVLHVHHAPADSP